jgi:hypothetical protein
MKRTMTRSVPFPPEQASTRPRWAFPCWSLPSLALVAALQLFWMDPFVGVYDESLVLFGADRVLHGEIPFRDFWSIYGPGAYYVLAGLFRIFGETAFVGRVADVVVKTAIVAIAYLIVRTFGARAIALVAASFVLLLLVRLANYGVPLFVAIFAAMAALYGLRMAAARGSPRLAAVSGALAAVGLLYRHDLGIYCVLVCALFLWRVRIDVRPRLAAADSLVAPFVWGLGAMLLPAVIYLGLNVPLTDLSFNLVTVPLAVYPSARALPLVPVSPILAAAVAQRSLPVFMELDVYFPFVVAVVLAALEARRLLGRRFRGGDGSAVQRPSDDLTDLFFRVLLLLHVLFIAKGWVRFSEVHMGAALVTTVVTVACAAARSRSPWPPRLVVASGLVILGLLVVKPSKYAASNLVRGISVPLGEAQWGLVAHRLCRDASLPRIRCLALDEDRVAVARFLLDNRGSDTRLYVGAGRHDKLYAGGVVLYFAAEAKAVTRWHDLHPGVQTRLTIQREMVGEMESSPPPFIVVDTTWDDTIEPNTSALSSGVVVLDEFLRRGYSPAFRSGAIAVLTRRERPFSMTGEASDWVDGKR